MSKANREAERIRRREDERLARIKAQRRRRWLLIGAICALVLIGIVIVIVMLNRDSGTPSASSSASASASASSAASASASASANPSTSTAPTTGTGADGKQHTLPPPSAAENRDWTSTLTLNSGAVTMDLDGKAAPQAVANYVTLAKDGYFNGTKCHRLVTDGIFVLQCGDPSGDGTGGPGYTFGPIENAPADGKYPAGTVAMARVGGDPNSMGSQFFLVYKDSVLPQDDGGYTVFGKITSGLDVVQAIADAGVVQDPKGFTAPKNPVTIEGVETK